MIDSQNCACINPVYQVTSRSCIEETCSYSDQELASHIQQKCSESESTFSYCSFMIHHGGYDIDKEIRPAFRPPTTVSPIASLTTNMMAIMTDRARNEAQLNKGNVEMELAVGAGILGLVFTLWGDLHNATSCTMWCRKNSIYWFRTSCYTWASTFTGLAGR